MSKPRLALLDLKTRERGARALRNWELPDQSHVYQGIDIADAVIATRVVNKTVQRFLHMNEGSETRVAAGHRRDVGVGVRAHFQNQWADS